MSESGTAAAQTVRSLAVGQMIALHEALAGADRQSRYHEGAQVPQGLFGDLADISVLANDCILATGHLREDGVVPVHVGQRMVQRAPIPLGTRLVVHANLASRRPIRAGTLATFAMNFIAPDESVPLRAEITSLVSDGAAMRAAAGGDGAKPAPAASRPDEPDPSEFALVAEKRLTPDRVAAYSHEFPDYWVHFRPDVARSIGFPKPVAQGLMSLTWMMEALAAREVPGAIDVEVSFRRPIFWDDAIEVRRRGDDFLVLRQGANGPEICSLGRCNPAA